VNQDLTEKQGVPVLSDCKRCGGRGYERIPSTEAYAAVCQITDAITLDTWKKSVALLRPVDHEIRYEGMG
jgi:hypothetical protein